VAHGLLCSGAMNGQTTSERRIRPRINYQGIVLVHSGSEQIPCQGLNLSESGILVRPSPEADPGAGAHFRVTFALPPSTGWVELQGRLAHCTWIHRRLTWGIQFSAVPVEVRGRLRQFVNEGLPAALTAGPGPSASQEVRFIPDPVPESCKVGAVDEDALKGLPTRRVPAVKMRRLAGNETTRRVPPEELERIKRAAASTDPDSSEDPSD
jgi:hypothetical protein